MKRFLLLALLSISIGELRSQTTVTLSPEEKKLASILNAYRKSKHLPELPVSKNLTQVAQAHCRDVAQYHDEFPKEANFHSWSTHGNWKAVDYYPDHRNAAGMWSKPKEITGFQGNGYEIFTWYVGDTDPMTAAEALKDWQGSQPHNNTILERGTFKGIGWKCMGVAIYRGYAAVWFSDTPDTNLLAK